MHGGHRASVDRAKVDRAARANRIAITVGSAVATGFAALLAIAIGSGFGVVTIVLAGLGLLASVASAVLAHRRQRALGLLVAAGDDLALAVDDDGVRLAGAPLVPWSEIVFVGVLDDRERTGRLRRIPVLGLLTRATVQAGSPTLLCELGVRDGLALRAAFGGAPGGERVTIFDEFDGVRRGLVPLMLDAVLDEAVAHQAAQVLVHEARRRGIPARAFDRIFAYFDWKGPMMDRKWPVEKGTPS